MIQGETYTVHIGSNLDILPTLPDNSVDSIVTDPPYGLSDNKFVADTIAKWISGERDFTPDGKGFMGKSWDAFVPPPALWDECLRVLKPGGHLLAFFGSRTQDIGALSIRLAGFEIRDSISWIYGSGFPKSLDISKAIDKAAGAERKVVGLKPDWVRLRSAEIERFKNGEPSIMNQRNRNLAPDFYKTEAAAGYNNPDKGAEITSPSTPEAQQWEGWGTALKPAFEPIVVARKPIKGTVANNVLKWGTGGLNIDGSRIGTREHEPQFRPAAASGPSNGGVVFGDREGRDASYTQGRWPSNVILDPYTAELLDEQSDASRFFYVAKASKRDRNEGLEELDPQRHSDRENAEGVGGDNPRNPTNNARQNFHPTVKPTDLMRYLVKLATPPGGTVLDPFTGSGSTGKAAILEGFRFIGCELTEDYIPIIEGRLAHAEKTKIEEPEGLF